MSKMTAKEFVAYLKDYLGAENERELATRLFTKQTNLSLVKTGKVKIGLCFLVRVHLATGIEMKQLYEMTGFDVWNKNGKES